MRLRLMFVVHRFSLLVSLVNSALAGTLLAPCRSRHCGASRQSLVVIVPEVRTSGAEAFCYSLRGFGNKAKPPDGVDKPERRKEAEAYRRQSLPLGCQGGFAARRVGWLSKLRLGIAFSMSLTSRMYLLCFMQWLHAVPRTVHAHPNKEE